MEQGWIKFYREWLDNPIIMKDAEHLATWIYLLSKAKHTKTEVIFNGEKIVLNAGQLIISCREIYEDLKIERNKLNRIFTSLKSEKLIEQQTSNHKSLITLPLWDFYQGFNEQPNEQQMSNQRVTNQETENEKEKRSKREKDKEKEIKKNERMKEYIYPLISPQGETGREDFPLKEKDLDKWLEEDDGIDEWDKVQLYYKQLHSSQQLAVSSQESAASSQQGCYTENGETNDLDNTNPIEYSGQWSVVSGQELDYDIDSDNTNGLDNTNPIQQKNKEIYIPQPQTPSPFAEGEHLPSGKYHSARGGTSLSSNGDTPPSPVTALFDEFWKAYPKKVGKGYAYDCFKKIKVSRKLLDIMLEAIAKQKKSDMWKRDKGQYIPNPSTWLNQKRWEDDLDGETDDNPWSSFKLGIEL